MNSKPTEKYTQVYDSVIVGAGASGIYTLWRLSRLEEFNKGRIALIESTGRIRGRVHSIEMGNKNSVGELGAMRYMDHHVIVRSLINQLRLIKLEDIHDFPTESMHLRGRNIPFKGGSNGLRGISPRFDEIYLVDQDERGRAPMTLFKLAMYRVLKKVHDQLPTIKAKTKPKKKANLAKLKSWLESVIEAGVESDWDYMCPIVGDALRELGQLDFGRRKKVKLVKLGFWSVLQNEISTEAFHLIRDGLGYYSVTTEWNAVEALIRFSNELGKDTDYRYLKCGMSGILNALLNEVKINMAEAGGELTIIRSNHVTKIEKITKNLDDEASSEEVTFDEVTFDVTTITPENPHKVFLLDPLYSDTTMKTCVFNTKNLVLCIPSRAIKNLELIGFGEARYNIRTAANSVHAFPLLKIILKYDKPAWWKHNNIKPHFDNRSKIVTDIPLRQIYMDAAEQQGDKHPYIMLYVDGDPLKSWQRDAFFNRHGSLPYIGDLNAPGRDKVPENLIITSITANKIAKLLSIVLDVSIESVEAPKSGSMASWDGYPYWAGWHGWEVGTDSRKIRKFLSKPFNAIDGLFGICGESMSSPQGWVESALRSVDLMMLQYGFDSTAHISEEHLKEAKAETFHDYLSY